VGKVRESEDVPIWFETAVGYLSKDEVGRWVVECVVCGAKFANRDVLRLGFDTLEHIAHGHLQQTELNSQ